MYIQKLLDKYHAVVAGDSEFANSLILPPKFCNFQEYKKVICHTTFVMTQLKIYGQPTKIYEHPDMGLNLLPSWEGNCALIDLLNLNQLPPPKKSKVKQFTVAFFFYFSAFDVFSLFRNKETQIRIAKQLLGGRLLREASFPNCLRTGEFIEGVDKKGKPEIQEVAIKLYDARGYTPAGVSGLKGTFDAWGVEFANKNWLKYFDITKMDQEYRDNTTLREVVLDNGEIRLMTPHQIVTTYAGDDGLTELFQLYENIHIAIQGISDRLELNKPIKNFQTIGNASNQIGIGAISKELGMENSELDNYKLAQYLYASSGYALLDGYHYTVNQLLNVDGGYCKNLKPCFPRINDLTLDMDLAGAYVSTMKSLPYPVGIPCVYSFPKDRDFRPNFYKEYGKLKKKNMLFNGAWAARVTTVSPLSFKQDLIFSKIFGATDFEKALVEDGEGFFVLDNALIPELNDKKILAEIPDGAFQLLNNEIVSGIITSDYVQFIETYWTKSEQKELWDKLRIDTLIFYNNNHLLDAETFKIEYEKLDNEIIHCFDGGSTVKDNRKQIWTRVETNEGWFGSLQTIRDEIKIEAKIEKEAGNKEKSIQLTAAQNGYKCVNNASYGVGGSTFYQTEKPLLNLKEDGTESYYAVSKMGNAVFAQNITARVRLAAYCMAKSLNGYPVITDGTPCNINQVWSWAWDSTDGRHFGSEFLWNLSRYNTPIKVDLQRRFNVKLEPLGGKQWEVINQEIDGKKNEWVTISNGEKIVKGTVEKWKEIDDMAYDHAKSLFGELDIFKQDIMRYASKDLYKGAAFQSQANYLFERFFETKQDLQGNPTAFTNKARGYNLSKLVHSLPTLDDEGKIHPYTTMVEDIYKNNTADVYIENIFSPELLGVSDFNKSENVTKDYIERGFLPHAPTFRSSKPSPFSLSMFRWNTRKQYEEWDKKVEKWKSKTGFGLELLFLTTEMVEARTPLNYTETINKIQSLIDNNTKQVILDGHVKEKLTKLRHPQLLKEDSFKTENLL